MIFEEARKLLWEGKKVSRESWVEGYYIEATHQDRTRRLKLLDNSGRDYGISAADELATNWIVWED